MADRRMLSKKITDHDNFISLSASAQALYMHLVMSADDEGFCNQVSLAMFKAHAGSQDLEALISKHYLMQFDNGVIVIKHWKINNYIRQDRLAPTACLEEKAQIVEKPNGSYTWQTHASQMSGTCPSSDRIEQDSIGKNSISSCSKGEVDFFELLNDEDIASLKSIYTDHYRLLDECQADANRKHKAIRKPYEYVIGYAENKGWPTR
jgi:hypothetical protein